MNTNELIYTHIPLAETLAKKKKRAVQRSVYYEDLQSAALTGLVDAASRYNGQVPFPNYAARRINGEMDEYIRDLAWSRGKASIGHIEKDFDVPDNRSVEKIDSHKAIEIMIAMLPPHGQQIFRWYYQENMTLREIGNRLGITESAVSVQFKNYRDFLRKRKDAILSKMDLY